MQKKYTVLVLPQDSDRVKSLSFPAVALRALFLVLLIFVFSLSWVVYDYTKLKGELSEFNALKAENTYQKKAIKSLSDKLSDVEDYMAKLKNFDKKLRVIANLDNNSEEFLGVGGLSPETEASPLSSRVEKERFIRELDTQLDFIKKEALKQEKSFGQLETHLLGQKAILASTPSIWPAKGWLSSGFGKRVSPFTGLKEFHKGLDIANRLGTPIIAPAKGVVTRIGKDRGLGRYIEINHGYGIKTKYGHLAKILVKRGQRVKRGDKIAEMGNTGRSTGPHLHYMVVVNGRYVNPKRYILN